MGEFFHGWRRKAGCVLLVIVLAVATFEWMRGPTAGLKDNLAMKQAILAHAPIGTEVEHATKLMEHEGFKCSLFANHDFTGDGGTRGGLDFVYCERKDSAGILEVRIWGVALVIADGKVTEVLVRNGIFGM